MGKSAKSRKSKTLSNDTARLHTKINLFNQTPVRKLFLKLDSLTPNIALGKRCRDENQDLNDYNEADPLIDMFPAAPAPVERRIIRRPSLTHRRTAAISSSSGLSGPSKQTVSDFMNRSRMALQNEDLSENAVVITALDDLPFCCHADLLVMSREELVSVALRLNAKLPSALQIDVSAMSGAFDIRDRIETLVGIKQTIPNAPKATKVAREDSVEDSLSMKRNITLPSFDFDMNMDFTPPTSPLSQKTRRAHKSANFLSAFYAQPRLAELREEDELDGHVESNRPQKRKRLSSEGVQDTLMNRGGHASADCFSSPTMAYLTHQPCTPRPYKSENPGLFKAADAMPKPSVASIPLICLEDSQLRPAVEVAPGPPAPASLAEHRAFLDTFPSNSTCVESQSSINNIRNSLDHSTSLPEFDIELMTEVKRQLKGTQLTTEVAKGLKRMCVVLDDDEEMTAGAF